MIKWILTIFWDRQFQKMLINTIRINPMFARSSAIGTYEFLS